MSCALRSIFMSFLCTEESSIVRQTRRTVHELLRDWCRSDANFGEVVSMNYIPFCEFECNALLQFQPIMLITCPRHRALIATTLQQRHQFNYITTHTVRCGIKTPCHVRSTSTRDRQACLQRAVYLTKWIYKYMCAYSKPVTQSGKPPPPSERIVCLSVHFVECLSLEPNCRNENKSCALHIIRDTCQGISPTRLRRRYSLGNTCFPKYERLLSNPAIIIIIIHIAGTPNPCCVWITLLSSSTTSLCVGSLMRGIWNIVHWKSRTRSVVLVGVFCVIAAARNCPPCFVCEPMEWTTKQPPPSTTLHSVKYDRRTSRPYRINVLRDYRMCVRFFSCVIFTCNIMSL